MFSDFAWGEGGRSVRLLTRSDFDGLACATLLEEAGVVDEYHFIHPKDIQDGLVEVGPNDVLANVPYSPGCGLWFDHHSSEEERLKMWKDHKVGIDFEGASHPAPSCARVIYDYYGGAWKFKKYDDSGLMAAVDKSDSASYTIDEIKNPKGWSLLSFIVDPRTGLGFYDDFRLDDHEFTEMLIGYCRTADIDTILQLDDVRERIERYFSDEDGYRGMIKKNSWAVENVILIDLRQVVKTYVGNRFLEYALFPEQNVSLRLIRNIDKDNILIAVGHSIINRTCKTDVGSLMLKYGGGGHRPVGTCQASSRDAAAVFSEIMEVLKKNG